MESGQPIRRLRDEKKKKPRGGLTTKLMVLKIQGPSLARAPHGIKINIQLRTEFCSRNIVFFIIKVPKIEYA